MDIVVLLSHSDLPFHRRAAELDATRLPVPADVLVYTCEEWGQLAQQGRAFWRALREEVVWVWGRP